MLCGLGGSQRQGLWQSDLQLLKLAIGIWIVTLMMGKEPELVREVERYRIVGLTSKQRVRVLEPVFLTGFSTLLCSMLEL